MQDFSPKSNPTVDERTAAEALKLAARLQGEQGRRVSVEELHRTADEAGIDREYLAAALEQVARNKEEPTEQMDAPQAAGIGVAIVGMLAAVIVAIVMSTEHVSLAMNGSMVTLMIIAIAGAVAGRRYRRRKRSRRSSSDHF